MDHSTPGLPVHQQLPEFTQTCPVSQWAIQPSHLLSFPSPPVFNISQHQGLLQWVSSSHQVAKVLELQLQHQSFQWISGLISLSLDWFDCLAIQRIFGSSPAPQFKTLNSSALSLVYGPNLTSIYVQVSSLIWSCPTLCYPVDCSMPGFSVHQ